MRSGGTKCSEIFSAGFDTGAQGGLHLSQSAGEVGSAVPVPQRNLYGTTELGGAHGYGVVFEITP